METWLTGRGAPFQRFFQRLLPPSPVKRRLSERTKSRKGSQDMFSKYHDSEVACALGALVFASLSVGAALFPLIVA